MREAVVLQVPNPTYFSQQLSSFSRADWLIFIINKSTDGKILIYAKSTFSCQTVNFLPIRFY